ncbi:RNA polymerase subunit sigma [Paenibacillus sp. GCM10023248]|uniref:RNA polymerase subunit sigma n=1 Tax=unclassified Paenibacillus TaxID=185978 RepID=UPI0023787FE1|nr:RNA polymerase subunit sigma [Paenibacillus sp. MAHUQ-63]MDD9269293.1 RNA polymerase subunit sigma [Paenibacillus sp. MAHUQ-63]
MKMNIVLSLVVILVTITGCFSKESKNAETSPLQTALTTSSSDFKLSDREHEVYSNFQKDLNEQHLKVLEPISIAKLYVQARLDNKNEVAYELYTDKSGYVQWSKEEDKKIPSSDRGTKEQILKTFRNIENGGFVQLSDFEGYIEYQSSEDAQSKSGFKMIKDDDGIWNVSFTPIQ